MKRKNQLTINDTLTQTEKYNLFVNNEVVGIFPELFISTDPFYKYTYPLCLGYYTERSPSKTVSPIYEQMIKFNKLQNEGKTEQEIIALTNTLIGKNIIRPKFIDKWTRIYNTLVEEYSPLDNYSHTEQKTGANTDTTTYDTTLGRTATNKDTMSYDTTTEDNGNTASQESTSTSVENADDMYGFNSTSPAGDSYSKETTTETVTGDADKNTTHNVQTKMGKDTKDYSVNETDKKTGTDTKNFTIDESITKAGRNSSGSELIQSEIELRVSQIFFDIVYKDIDSIATIAIYN